MTMEQLQEIVIKQKAMHPIWFELEQDPVCTKFHLDHIEKQLSLRLPTEYREFLKTFGGGYFGFVNIYSGHPDGNWYILNIKDALVHLKTKSFLPVSDAETGDFYGFRVAGGICESEVSFFDHDMGQVVSTAFENIFDFIAVVGLMEELQKNR